MSNVGFANRADAQRVRDVTRKYERGRAAPMSIGAAIRLTLRPGALFSEDATYREAEIVWYSPETDAYEEGEDDLVVLVRTHESATPPPADVIVEATLAGELIGTLEHYAVYMTPYKMIEVVTDVQCVDGEIVVTKTEIFAIFEEP